MAHNLLVLAVTALIPLIVGSAWYSPMLFAKAWQEATGITPEKAKQSSMALSMGLLYIFSFFISVFLVINVIHQFGLNSMLQDKAGHDALSDPNSNLHKLLVTLWSSHGHSFRTYRHGALHGAISAVFVALPLIASGAVFEQRGFKYIMITWGFWLINFILMGAVLCHWIVFEMV
jgi:Protein of unknown function (DUF1761)